MVNEYLEKQRDLLVIRRMDLEAKKLDISNHIKENIKFIQLLEESTDPNYASFTPRDITGHNQEHIDKLKEEQKTLLSEADQVAEELSKLFLEIGELESVIKYAKEKLVSSMDSEADSIELRMAVLKAQETERQRIARELHDVTAQNLTALVHKTEFCSKLIDVDPLRCKLEMMTLNKYLRDSIEDTRNMIYNLRPMSFDDIGFHITVERFLDKLRSNTTVQFIYKEIGESYPIDPVISITLLRIIQEACNNAVKHAEAKQVTVTLSYSTERLCLRVEDDGVGFDISKISSKANEDNSGFGLSVMKERVYLLSGNFEIESSEGEGSKIIVTIPMNKEMENNGN